jgi:hypothetical protein
MFQIQNTIIGVMAVLCISVSSVSAQTQTAQTTASAESASDGTIKLVTIARQPLFVAQESSAEQDGTVSDQCLVAMLNFFMEVPPPSATVASK